MTKAIAIIGAGYVGLPLAAAFAGAGRSVTCIDSDETKIAAITAGQSYIEDVPAAEIARLVAAGLLAASTSYAACVEADAILICLPTPLSTNREPDLTIVTEATKRIARHLQPDTLVVLESTTYPGTTREVLRPILETSGLRAGRASTWRCRPSGSTPAAPTTPSTPPPRSSAGSPRPAPSGRWTCYSSASRRWSRVSSCDAAELTKLLENIFRSVNIALVNELAMLCDRMSLNVWEVVEAAATKPYGFMPFSPARARRALPADRPVLPQLEGARVRLPDRVHRARRQGQPAHALLLRRARRRGR